jgi:hypothetical protein
MNNLKKVTLAALQATVAVGSMSSLAVAADHQFDQKPSQIDINRASLKAIEASWLNVPRICKAAGFNAEPVSLPIEARSQSVNSIYLHFAV